MLLHPHHHPPLSCYQLRAISSYLDSDAFPLVTPPCNTSLWAYSVWAFQFSLYFLFLLSQLTIIFTYLLCLFSVSIIVIIATCKQDESAINDHYAAQSGQLELKWIVEGHLSCNDLIFPFPSLCSGKSESTKVKPDGSAFTIHCVWQRFCKILAFLECALGKLES